MITNVLLGALLLKDIRLPKDLLLQVFSKFEGSWAIFEAFGIANNKEMPNGVKIKIGCILNVYMEQNKAFNSQNKMYYIPFLV